MVTPSKSETVLGVYILPADGFTLQSSEPVKFYSQSMATQTHTLTLYEVADRDLGHTV